MKDSTKKEKIVEDALIRYVNVKEKCPFCQQQLIRIEKDKLSCSNCGHYYDRTTLAQFKSLIEKAYNEGYEKKRTEVYKAKLIDMPPSKEEEQAYKSTLNKLNSTFKLCVIPYCFGLLQHTEQVHDFFLDGLVVRTISTFRPLFQIEGIRFTCRKCKKEVIIPHWNCKSLEKLGAIINLGDRTEKLCIKDYNER